MRKIFEVLRLSVYCGRSHYEIAWVIDPSPWSVGEILRRIKFAGLAYSLYPGITETDAEALLYWPLALMATRRPEPD
jgi:hypothetical protein